ncbi:hypothetical protein OKW50_006832 [Paraburkholderia youngii]
MNTRSPVSIASQLGTQAWFRKRALLPPWLPSITRPSDRSNTNVWPDSERWLAAARCQLVSSPLYSMTRWPAAIGCIAKSPMPWTGERRAVMRRNRIVSRPSGASVVACEVLERCEHVAKVAAIQCLPFKSATNSQRHPSSHPGFAPKPANRGDQDNANQHASIKAPSPTTREHVAQPTAVWLRARCRSRFCNVS